MCSKYRSWPESTVKDTILTTSKNLIDLCNHKTGKGGWPPCFGISPTTKEMWAVCGYIYLNIELDIDRVLI